MTKPKLSRIPRIAWILAVVLVVAAGTLWKIRSNRPAFEYGLGGPLVPLAPEQISGLLVTQGGAQIRLDRTGAGQWSLTGALTDFVNPVAMETILTDLTRAEGGPLLPGTQPEDRRYDFTGPDAVRLTVFPLDGEPLRLSLGATNPVTGLVYASGARRRACFPVRPAVREVLRGLPESIRVNTLLPPFRFDGVAGVEIRGGRSGLVLQRRQDQWWIRAEDNSALVVGELAESYQRRYSDRRWEYEGQVWILADPDAVQLLLYEISALLVRAYVPPAEAESHQESWRLDPPYRQVILTGHGLNPLAGEGVADELSVAFGISLDGTYVPARRLGNTLLTDEVALRTLEKPASHLVITKALTFPVVHADSLRLESAGELVMRGHRDPEKFAAILERKGYDLDRTEGRDSWVVDFPVLSVMEHSVKASAVRLQTLVVELERIPILTVLPPAETSGVFLAENRSRVTVYRDASGSSGPQIVELGWLDLDHLPAGSPPLAPTENSERPAGLRLPRTGQLFQVPADLLVTIRNLPR